MILSATLLFICAVFAFGLSAICGGGASFILIPLLSQLLPGAQVPAALSIGTATSSFSRIILFRKHISWKIVVWFVPAAIPAVWLGAWLLTYINPVYLEWVLGIFLLSNITLLLKSKEQKQASRMPAIMLSLIGLVAGFVSGLTGAVGLLFNRFYLRYGLSKDEIIATRAANELLLHLIKLVIYASFSLLTGSVIGYGMLVAAAALFSSFAVKYILPYVSERLFQKTGYAAMVVSGIFMFVNASNNVINQNEVQLSYKSVEEGLETKMQWRQRTFQIDLEFDDGSFEIEYAIKPEDLPAEQQALVKVYMQTADYILLEEVYGINKHYYEVYVYKDGKLSKYDI